MKKFSKVQLKQQAIVMSVADALEAQARAELPGMLQCWFNVEYQLFPGSLLLRFQFENESALAAAEPELLAWQKRLSAAMLKKRRGAEGYAEEFGVYLGWTRGLGCLDARNGFALLLLVLLAAEVFCLLTDECFANSSR